MPHLWLAGRLPGLNELLDGKAQHGKWNAYNAQKGKLAQQIGLVAMSRGLALQSPCYVSMLVQEPNRKRDPDNILGGAFKIILDALTACGVLAGDGWSEILGLAGHWAHAPHRVGTFIHFSQSGLVTKDTLQLLLEESISNGNSVGKNGNGTGNRRDAGHGADAAQAAGGDAKPGSQLGSGSTVG